METRGAGYTVARMDDLKLRIAQLEQASKKNEEQHPAHHRRDDARAAYSTRTARGTAMSDEPHQTSRLIEEEDVDRDIDKIEEASRQLHDLLVLFERTYSRRRQGAGAGQDQSRTGRDVGGEGDHAMMGIPLEWWILIFVALSVALVIAVWMFDFGEVSDVRHRRMKS